MNTSALDPRASGSTVATPSQRQMTPLMVANFAALSSNYAFIALVGALAAVLGLQAWHLGTIIGVVGVLWMASTGRWAGAAQRLGHAAALRRALLGIMVSFALLAGYVHWALGQAALPSAVLSFAVLLLTRAAAGACTAGVPVLSIGWIASRTAPSARAAVMARYGAAGAVGMVIAPPVVGWLSHLGISVTLWLVALLPLLPVLLLGALHDSHQAGSPPPQRAAMPITDPRIRQPWLSALALYSVVIIANVCIGFLLIERMGLAPAEAAAAAGTALGAAGLALMLAQTVVSRFPSVTPINWLRAGALLAAGGFGSVLVITEPWMVAISFFVAGCGMGLNFPSIAALAANSVDGPEQGACAAGMGKAQGASMVIAPVVGALLYELDPRLPFVLMVCLLALVWAMAWFTRKA